MIPTYGKQEIRGMITNAYVARKTIKFTLDDLRYAFGFKRMNGEEILLRQLFSNKTEEQLQYIPKHQLIENIETWCKEQNIQYYYDYQTDSYFFK